MIGVEKDIIFSIENHCKNNYTPLTLQMHRLEVSCGCS